MSATPTPPPVPARLRAIQPSITLSLSARVKAMVKEGVAVANLTAGEPDRAPPAFVTDAMRGLDPLAATRYTDTRGLPEVRAQVAAWIAREGGATWAADEVLLLDGAKRALALGIEAAFDEGDEVLLVAPYWVSYPAMLALAGARPVVVQARADHGFRPPIQAIEAAIGPRTRGVILNTPQNPTGVVYGPADLDALAELARRHDLLLISDEIYHHIQFGEPPEPPLLGRHPDLKGRTLVVNSLSKTYAVPGWRIGFAAGPRWWIDRMARVWGHTGSNLCVLLQQVLGRVLEAPTTFTKERAAEFRARRDHVLPRLAALPGARVHRPEGAFYVLPDLGAWMERRYRGEPLGSAVRLAEILLNDYRVAVVPGDDFGAPGAIRLSLAVSPDTLDAGAQALEDLAGVLA